MTRSDADVGALFDTHAGDLLRYLRRRVGPDAAEDLLHETFVALLRREAPARAADGGDRAWLFGVATNLVRHHARGLARAAAASARLGGPEPHDDPVGAVAGRVDAARAVKGMAAALRDLDPDDRDVLLFVAWAGLTPTEAGAALGIPAGTARSRLHRVRRTLHVAAPGPEEGSS